MLIHGLNNGRKLMKAANAYKSFVMGPVRNTGWHTLGTCCMGKDPKNSVVNEYGKVHDLEQFIYIRWINFSNIWRSKSSFYNSSNGFIYFRKIVSRYFSLIKK